jgi:hypothetical protein
MDEAPVLARIEELVDEEHRLWRAEGSGDLSPDERARLELVRGELDRCWATLRRRRAGAPDGLPDDQVPDPPNDLDGPNPEPVHLEHGVHDDEPSPDPDINPNVP